MLMQASRARVDGDPGQALQICQQMRLRVVRNLVCLFEAQLIGRQNDEDAVPRLARDESAKIVVG
jgi:hypothetical protein